MEVGGNNLSMIKKKEKRHVHIKLIGFQFLKCSAIVGAYRPYNLLQYL